MVFFCREGGEEFMNDSSDLGDWEGGDGGGGGEGGGGREERGERRKKEVR